MPWNTVKLNDGHEMPTLAFGTWRIGNGDGTVDNVKTAIDVGFTHVDTAQAYQNEIEAGKAIRQYPRDKVFVTTKWSGRAGLEDSIHDSLKNLGISYIDLYLIHAPSVAKPNIREAWAGMERLKDAGLVRSIGVSNFDDGQLAELIKHAKYPPAANQIEFHPYVFRQQLATLAYCAKKKIVVEGYSSLIPLTHTEGPVRGLVGAIAAREHVTPEMVLLAWAKAKGVVVVTTSSKQWRLEDYIKAGELALTTEDESGIEEAGAPGPPSGSSAEVPFAIPAALMQLDSGELHEPVHAHTAAAAPPAYSTPATAAPAYAPAADEKAQLAALDFNGGLPAPVTQTSAAVVPAMTRRQRIMRFASTFVIVWMGLQMLEVMAGVYLGEDME